MLCCLPEPGPADTRPHLASKRANPPRPLHRRPYPENRAGSERILQHNAFIESTPGLSGFSATKVARPAPGPSGVGWAPTCPGPAAWLPHRLARPARPGPAPPHPGRQPAPRLHGNSRATRPGRRDEEEPQRLSDSPYRHCGFLPCPVDVPARGAVQQRRLRGRRIERLLKHLLGAPKTAAPLASSLCAGALRARPAPSPGTNSSATRITPAPELSESVS